MEDLALREQLLSSMDLDQGLFEKVSRILLQRFAHLGNPLLCVYSKIGFMLAVFTAGLVYA